MAGALDNDLAVLITEMHANVSHAESLTAGLSHAQFNWRPEPAAWSIGQNLAHLNAVNGMHAPALRAAIESGHERRVTGEGPFSYGFLTRKFVASLEPLGTSRAAQRRFKAPRQFQPQPESVLEPTLAEYRRISGEIRELMYLATGLHLSRVKTILPALPVWMRTIYRMPLGARFAMVAAHDRRHLSQAEAIRNREEFPG